MNRFKNLFLLGYALFVIGMLAVSLIFIACSNGDDSGSPTGKPGNNGQFSTSAQSVDFSGNIFGVPTVLHLYADETYVMVWADFPKERGTYSLTGDFTDGTLILHMKEKCDTITREWKEKIEDETIIITNGTFQEMGQTFTKVDS